MEFFLVCKNLEFLTCVEIPHSGIRIQKGSLDLSIILMVQFEGKSIRLAKS